MFGQTGYQNINYTPIFKQYAIGKGIDNNEHIAITQCAKRAFLAKMSPMSTHVGNLIKQAIGGEWFVHVSPVNDILYDFSLTSVSGNDFITFSYDNTMFQVCRLR